MSRPSSRLYLVETCLHHAVGSFAPSYNCLCCSVGTIRTRIARERFTTTEEDAPKLAEVFDGRFFEPIGDDLDDALSEARIKWVLAPTDSPVPGRSIGDVSVRSRTGISIPAVKRGERSRIRLRIRNYCRTMFLSWLEWTKHTTISTNSSLRRDRTGHRYPFDTGGLNNTISTHPSFGMKSW
jgi:hypothetical protein